MEIIAYYLPQYHPFKENNEWWGEGFTEWTNVGKATPLYKNHYQPKVPKDLGYYDLRVSDVRENQAELAREAGVTAFCYWHYWFGDGRMLLDMPLREILATKKPDFPFCLGWANESWKAKVWNNSPGSKDRLLIEQRYPGSEDLRAHFEYVLHAIRDKRYFQKNGRPVFVVLKPLLHPDARNFLITWNKWLKEEGFANGFYFVGHTNSSSDIQKILDLGFDSVNLIRLGEYRYNIKLIKKIFLKIFIFKLFRGPLKINYSMIYKYFIGHEELKNEVVPTLIPNWDHTPRSGRSGVVFHGSTPKLFEKHALDVFELVKKKDNQLIFLKSWNEWGEGNYMEPDIRFGKGYLIALKSALDKSAVKNSHNE